MGQPPACKQSLTITTGVTWCAVPLLLVVRAGSFPLCNMTFCCTHFCARTFVQHPALSEGFCATRVVAHLCCKHEWCGSNLMAHARHFLHVIKPDVRCPRLQETLLLLRCPTF